MLNGGHNNGQNRIKIFQRFKEEKLKYQQEVKQLQAKIVAVELENKKLMEKFGLLGEDQKKLLGSKF